MRALGWIRGQCYDVEDEGWMWSGGKEPGEKLKELLSQYQWSKQVGGGGGWFEPNYH